MRIKEMRKNLAKMKKMMIIVLIKQKKQKRYFRLNKIIQKSKKREANEFKK